MSAIGAGAAPFMPDRISTVAAVLTFYLVATAWVTVRRKEGSAGLFEEGSIGDPLSVLERGPRPAARQLLGYPLGSDSYIS